MLRPPTAEIVLALCRCVRAFSRRQIADGFFGGDRAKANRKILTLESCELIVKKSLLIRDIGALTQPIYTWAVGGASPNFQSLVFVARRRWETAPTKVAPVVLAGPAAQSLLGIRSTGSLKRPVQASHDLGVAEAYLAVRRDRPHLAKFWYGEDSAPKQLGSIPDAIYIDRNGDARLAFEFCGLYSAKRLQAFHRHCTDRRLSYELW